VSWLPVPALGPGHPSDWCPLNPCQGAVECCLRVYLCLATQPCAVVLPVTDAPDGELARPQDRGTGGMTPFAPPRASTGLTAPRLSGPVTWGPMRVGHRRGPAGPKSGRPDGQARVRVPEGAQPATDSRCAACGTMLSSRGAFACAAARPRRAPRALEKM
jgi:hypothetical protein